MNLASGTSECRFSSAVPIDVLEETIYNISPELLDILLFDRTTRSNIIWATSDYSSLGKGYEPESPIQQEQITGEHASIIQPRVAKALHAQAGRTRDKAEVFTPCWICNKQNNLLDEQWFGRPGVFNAETETGWIPTTEPIVFALRGKTWKRYIDEKRLEITCGEAPYLVSRYDTVTGELIPLEHRIGLLDRKMRVVNENTTEPDDWLKCALRAYQSVYGYEYQGDNLLLARENLFVSFIDYYRARFSEQPSIRILKQIARVVSWNLWQMDGMKLVVPYSCHPIIEEDVTLFGVERTEKPCPGCAAGGIHNHTGVYCKVHDWRDKSTWTYISLMKGGSQ